MFGRRARVYVRWSKCVCACDFSEETLLALQCAVACLVHMYRTLVGSVSSPHIRREEIECSLRRAPIHSLNTFFECFNLNMKTKWVWVSVCQLMCLIHFDCKWGINRDATQIILCVGCIYRCVHKYEFVWMNGSSIIIGYPIRSNKQSGALRVRQ